LLAASLADPLLNTRVSHTLYLAPFGFIGFLLAHSLYPILLDYQKRRKATQAPVIYSLTFDPERAWFDTRLSDLQPPPGKEPEAAVAQPSEPAPATNREVVPFSAFLPDDKVNCAAREGALGHEVNCAARQGESSPSGERGCPGGEGALGHKGRRLRREGALGGEAADVAVIEPGTKADSKDSSGEKGKQTTWQALPTPMSKRGQSSLNTVSDDLIDIAVYATMALNRFKRGDADPQVLEMLCKKIRTKAIKTRRMANSLSRPGKPGNDVM
jgi:hypothetical protein